MRNMLLEDIEYAVTETPGGVWKQFMYENGRVYREYTSNLRLLGLPLIHFTRGICPGDRLAEGCERHHRRRPSRGGGARDRTGFGGRHRHWPSYLRASVCAGPGGIWHDGGGTTRGKPVLCRRAVCRGVHGHRADCRGVLRPRPSGIGSSCVERQGGHAPKRWCTSNASPAYNAQPCRVPPIDDRTPTARGPLTRRVPSE
jgi:hypothetical protein